MRHGSCFRHATGIHGGGPPRVVGIAAAIAFVFGSGTLLAAAFGADETVHGAVVGSAGIIGPS